MASTARAPRRRGAQRPKIEDHHAEWLSLIETSGPFLTVPTLKRTMPDGLDSAPANLPDLRVAYAEYQADPELQQRWVRWVLNQLLDLSATTSEASDADPSHRVAEHAITLRPSYVVRDHTQTGNPTVLLVHRLPQGTALDRPLTGESWAATPLDRAAELARATEIPLALVTNGMHWSLVWARPGQSTGIATWRADIWLEEPITLRAFVTLLGARRFFNVPTDQDLATLLQESASKQQEVADQLGSQVRHAVELLIATLDYQDRERKGELLADLEAAEVYRGAITVVMRLVFLFVAEERRLLPIDDPRYAETLAASTLRAQLQERADRDLEDALERSTAAWHRILALFRAVHGGIEHDALRLPAYGGGLFDPDRYPFLEGRKPGTSWREQAATPLHVDDRTILHVLDALQTLDQGGARVLLSYQALDVEQIGHVYEGLLDHTAVRDTDPALALTGKYEPELALTVIEQWAATSQQELIEQLAKATGKSPGAITKALQAELTDEQRSRLRAACDSDDELLARVAPYHALLRPDLRSDPQVILPGSLFVTQTLERRSSGTYYTPRVLAEEVVQHTLDPIVYHPGPAQERDPAKWKLRPANELLDLKVADIAMGSGAFLVAACRYLAARLLEAWKSEAVASGAGLPGPAPAPTAQLPADPLEREALAHRLIAERCLYGVDRNPMAVEMAKLSLWLITLARDRPFSFVDHALRTGDSLLGITDVRQLRVANLDPGFVRQTSIDLGFEVVDAAVTRALNLRHELEAFVVNDVTDANRKSELLREADGAMNDARVLADLVVGAALAQVDEGDPLSQEHVAGWVRTMVEHAAPAEDWLVAQAQLRALADGWLVERRRAVGQIAGVVWGDRRPFHWTLEFPEVWERGGFDAVVGNPPFQGGQKITGALGGQYRDYLIKWLADGVKGSADLVAYFYLRATGLLSATGGLGLIATNTLAQGDTREVGLDQLAAHGWTLHRAVSSEPWPGGANLEMATVWARRGAWEGTTVLNRAEVGAIAPSLTTGSRMVGNAERLQSNSDRSFIGSYVLGMGFVLSPSEAEAMLGADPKNWEVVKPYLIGDDLNSRPDGSPARWVIDFRDLSEEEAARYELPFARVLQRVKPERDRNKRDARRKYWWRYAERSARLYRAISPLTRCIVTARVSKVIQPMFTATDIVLDQQLVVLVYDDDAHFGLLSSGVHWNWAAAQTSTMRTDARYNPSDCFETFVQPQLTEAIGLLGCDLNEHRSGLMLSRRLGLTSTYNRFHDPGEQADDIVRLREIHVELDHAVRDAYGWNDLHLDHGFNETKFGTRYTFAPGSRQEVLDRLLELNHARYAEEVAQGLHSKGKSKSKRSAADARNLSLFGD